MAGKAAKRGVEAAEAEEASQAMAGRVEDSAAAVAVARGARYALQCETL